MGFWPEDQYDYSQDYPQLGTKSKKLLEKNFYLDLPVDLLEVDKISEQILTIIKRYNRIPEFPCNGNARFVVNLTMWREHETIVSWGENHGLPYKSPSRRYNEDSEPIRESREPEGDPVDWLKETVKKVNESPGELFDKLRVKK